MHLNALWTRHFFLNESKKSSLEVFIPQAASRMLPAIPLSSSALQLNAQDALPFYCYSHAPHAATRFLNEVCMLRPTPAYSSDLLVPSSLFDFFNQISYSLKPSYLLNYSFLWSIFTSISLICPIIPSHAFVFLAVARLIFATCAVFHYSPRRPCQLFHRHQPAFAQGLSIKE